MSKTILVTGATDVLGQGVARALAACRRATRRSDVTNIVPHSISTLESGIDATMRLVVGDDVEGVTRKYFDV